MGLAFGSINTGLPKNIVQQIIAAERAPIAKLEGRKEKLHEKSQLLNELGKLVQDLRADLEKNSATKDFGELKVLANEELVSVVVDKDFARPGEYQMEIDTLAQKSSAITTGFEDPDNSYIGVGFIQYNLPDGETRDLYVDEDNASLRGVMKLINSDESNGLRATLINDEKEGESSWKLIISLEQTGTNQRADFPYFYFVDGEDDFSLELEREANNAKVKLDGFEIELPKNKTKDLIQGLDIEFKKARPGEEFTIKIIQDIPVVKDKIKGIVEKINNLLTFINTQNDLNEKTDTSRTLGGDLTLQTLQGRIRETVFTPIQTNAGVRRLSDFAVRFQKNGLLEIDEKKFEAILSKEFLNVSEFMTGGLNKELETHNEGFLSKLIDVTKLMLRIPDGPITLRKDGLRRNVDQLDSQIESKERIIARREEMLKDKFSRLEGVMSKLKSQGAGLAGLSSGMDPIQQLSAV